MADGHALEKLVHVGLDQRHAHAIRPARVHVFFQVFVKPLEHEVKAVLGVLHVHQVNDVGMRQLLKKRDLTQRRGRYALVLDLETDLFESDRAARCLSDKARCFVDNLCSGYVRVSAGSSGARGQGEKREWGKEK